VEKYGDLITNGLDLVSFLLVTPEVIRFVEPLVEWGSKVLLTIMAIAALLVVALNPLIGIIASTVFFLMLRKRWIGPAIS
jgi:hypothetical protein